jgi:hypothetical protein
VAARAQNKIRMGAVAALEAALAKEKVKLTVSKSKPPRRFPRRRFLSIRSPLSVHGFLCTLDERRPITAAR